MVPEPLVPRQFTAEFGWKRKTDKPIIVIYDSFINEGERPTEVGTAVENYQESAIFPKGH